MVRNVKGFTMVELMIVIAIIGVLAVSLIPTLTGAQAKSRDTARVSILTNASTSITSYASDVSVYPATTNGCLTDVAGLITGYITASTQGDITSDVSKNFSNGKAGLDPNKQTIAGNICAVVGAFGYQAIKVTTNADSGLFQAKVESTTRGNSEAPTAVYSTDGSSSGPTTSNSGVIYARIVSAN